MTVFGIVILLRAWIVSIKFKQILTINDYRSYQWLGVQILIVFFAIAYAVHGVTLGDFIELPIDLTTLVTLVYFFGSIFVIVTLLATNNMIVAILGSKISDRDAIDIFRDRMGIEEEIAHLNDQFVVNCSFCAKIVKYSVADVVRSHVNILDRGVSVVNTFGVRSFILRPSHKCKDGRREMTIIHDDALAFRAVDNSRLIAGEDF